MRQVVVSHDGLATLARSACSAARTCISSENCSSTNSSNNGS